MKVLVVDDETLDLFITKKLIGVEHEVTGFNSVQEATDWAGSNPFDVLLSDYYLGEGKHAHDLLKALKQVAPSPFAAIVLSNHINEKQSQDLKREGFVSIIEKPVTLEKLRQCLARIPK